MACTKLQSLLTAITLPVQQMWLLCPIHTADTTQLDSWVASASAVCIGL